MKGKAISIFWTVVIFVVTPAVTIWASAREVSQEDTKLWEDSEQVEILAESVKRLRNIQYCIDQLKYSPDYTEIAVLGVRVSITTEPERWRIRTILETQKATEQANLEAAKKALTAN